MDQLRMEGFIGKDSLRVERLDARHWIMEGQIACLGNIRISVDKTLTVVESGSDPRVQTTRYAYNASVGGRNSLLRYDNQHPEWRYPGHADEHHRHLLDWRTEEEEELPGSPEWVGEANWPTLGDFIREVRDWYWGNRSDLAEPDVMANQLRGE